MYSLFLLGETAVLMLVSLPRHKQVASGLNYKSKIAMYSEAATYLVDSITHGIVAI